MSIKLGSSLLAGNLDKNMYPSKDEMNELFSSSVKLDGDQEISGNKNFTGNLMWGGKDVETISSIQNISSTSGTVSLLANNVYKMSLSGATTFSLTTPTNMAILNQIEVQINMSSVQTINLGTTRYFGGSAPDLSESGAYTLIYEYDTVNNVWVVGALRKAVG